MKTLEQLREELKSLYDVFFADNEIDPITGIWKNAPEGKNLRFATMPHIGNLYAEITPKILFVGKDIGMDELFKYNTFNSLADRNGCFTTINPAKAPNAHTAGTFIAALYLLKETSQVYEKVWDFAETMIDTQNKSVVKKITNKFDLDALDVLQRVSQTNFYKYVTVGRGYMSDDGNVLGRSGASDRRFFADEQMKIENLFLEEVKILNPDIVWFQAKDFNRYNVYRELKKTGRKVIVSSHPSYLGACKPRYVVELLKD